MKKNIILAGVGGQGILSIATVIGEAATKANLYLKQAEVHGMSQRGGDVQSNLRLSTEEIYSDLIPQGQADIIIAMEPMEALRYVPYLNEEGWVITSSEPLINIPNYPDTAKVADDLKRLPRVKTLPIDSLAKENHTPKSANMILLGMAAEAIGILSPAELRDAIGRIFARKGEQVVEDNYKAFDLGLTEK
ncbi:MAG: indolepyruvate oxidoreductase subunit beta [Prevotella sp.]|nr:indolepyruvate oxidoreductase subunit beta [Prevotella sp.]